MFFIGFRAVFGGNYFLIIFPLIFIGPLLLIGFQQVDRVEFKLSALFNKIKDRLYRSILIFLVMITGYIILIYDFIFALNKIGDNKFLLIFPVLILYLVIIFNMFQLNLWGLLILKPGIKLWEQIKASYRLTINNFGFAFFWSFIIVTFGLLLIFSRIGALIFLNSFVSILTINGTEYMLDQMS